jgi:hypothetical protein
VILEHLNIHAINTENSFLYMMGAFILEARFLLYLGGVVLVILIISIYLVPNVFCPGIRHFGYHGTVVPSLNDPINGVCSSLGK